MRNVVLRPGSSGPFVRDLQLALNNRLNPSPNLIVNGLFTPQTQMALRSFQRANWLEEDGIAGPCTLDALYDTEAMRPVLHNVQYVAAPSPKNAWAAAIAMLKGSAIDSILFTAPKSMIDDTGDLIAQDPAIGFTDRHISVARAFGLRYYPQQAWPVASLMVQLQSGPVMLVLKSDNHRMRRGGAFKYVIVVGARGSHAADGNSTTLLIYDTSPDRRGSSIYSATYTSMLRSSSLLSFGMLTN